MYRKGETVIDAEGELCVVLNDNQNGTFLVQYEDGLILTVEEFWIGPLKEPDLDFLDEEWYDDEEDLAPYRELAQYND